MNKITINLNTPYDVLIGSGILKQAGALISAVKKPCRAAIICDENVFPLYATALELSINAAGFHTDIFTIKGGESSKSISALTELLNFLAQHDYTRSDCLLALGGGVTGDLVGFAASIYLRGIDFIQIPTTLLAAVDSSVGGKTGINLDAGKNLAGSFYQPKLVLCDTDTFATLPPHTFSDGVSEAIKYGVICRADLFEALSLPSLIDVNFIVSSCVDSKRQLVELDERDIGLRQLLNLGHTVGHAIEKLSCYTISHGSAVAIGMCIITLSAEKACLCAPLTYAKLKSALELHNLPCRCDFSAQQLAAAALKDKKRQGDTITLVLPQKIGCSILHKLPMEHLEGFIANGLEEV